MVPLIVGFALQIGLISSSGADGKRQSGVSGELCRSVIGRFGFNASGTEGVQQTAAGFSAIG
jgi:hypothetical protein